jgi:hypothetical protein
MSVDFLPISACRLVGSFAALLSSIVIKLFLMFF